MTTKLLSRDDILRVTDIKREMVDMAPFGWGGAVYVSGQTGKQRADFESFIAKAVTDNAQENATRFRAKLLVSCITDSDGNRLFREEDIDVLNEKSAGALDHLYEVAQRLSGFRKADIDEMTKNLPQGQSEDSTTA